MTVIEFGTIFKSNFHAQSNYTRIQKEVIVNRQIDLALDLTGFRNQYAISS